MLQVRDDEKVLFKKCCGFRNKSEELTNNNGTAFGLASGTKLFTGLAICKLMDDKKLSPDSLLCDILPYDLGKIAKSVTIFHLLTHTSGVGDYYDEDAEDVEAQMQALYGNYPVYQWERLEYYLQMITPLPPKFEPGEGFCYSNTGFILLGLVIEAISGVSYQQFITDTIIAPLRLAHTGFYRADSLPANTALGYTYDDENGEWRTNIFQLPILGGSDGGIYSCAEDLNTLWRAVFSNELFSVDMLSEFIKQQSIVNDAVSYGFGVWRFEFNGTHFFYAIGSDPGIDFFTAYSPKNRIVVSALGNTEVNTFTLVNEMMGCIDFT